MKYHLPYNIMAVGKNIQRKKGEGDGNFGEEYQVVWNFIHPWSKDEFLEFLRRELEDSDKQLLLVVDKVVADTEAWKTENYQ